MVLWKMVGNWKSFFEPLPLKPIILVKKSVVLVKRENGFTKMLFYLVFQGFLSRGWF